MRGRGVEAEREQKPLRKKWVQHPIYRARLETARSKPSLSSRNGRSARVFVNIPAVAEREYQNPPASAPRMCERSFSCLVNTLRQRQDGRHFPEDIFKCIFLNENVQISIKISLKFVPKGPINNIPALVQIMAWRRPGAEPLSEPMMVSLLTHIWVTRPQWVILCTTLSWFPQRLEVPNRHISKFTHSLLRSTNRAKHTTFSLLFHQFLSNWIYPSTSSDLTIWALSQEYCRTTRWIPRYWLWIRY